MESFMSFSWSFQTHFDEISDRAIGENKPSHDPSIAPQNPIKLFFDFQILSDDRGPGPLSPDKIWKKYI